MIVSVSVYHSNCNTHRVIYRMVGQELPRIDRMMKKRMPLEGAAVSFDT